MCNVAKSVPDWLNVSRETVERLEFFATEVCRWTPSINLISKASVADVWSRHVLDSAQLYDLAQNHPGPWLDMGSGGGFPGIVLAIMGAAPITLAESDQRKAAFLRHVSQQLGLPVQVLARRLDELPPARAGIVSARALSALTDLMTHANRHLLQDGVAIFPKGRGAAQEIELARNKWQFDLQQVSSKTDPEASILLISNIEPR